MKKVLVGTMIVMALITGCSEDNDPAPKTCEQATAEEDKAKADYKVAYDNYYVYGPQQGFTVMQIQEVYGKALADTYSAMDAAMKERGQICK
jgi:hypothetical protein